MHHKCLGAEKAQKKQLFKEANDGVKNFLSAQVEAR